MSAPPDDAPRRPTISHERAEWWASLPDPVAVIDGVGGHVLDVNEALVRLSGRSRDQWQGSPATELVVRSDQVGLSRLIALAGEGASGRDELELVRVDAGALPIEASSAPTLGSDGNPVVLLAMRDITRRREAEGEIHGLYREFALLHLVRERIGNERDPSAIGEQVLDALFKILDRDVGSAIYLSEDEAPELFAGARRRVPEALLMAFGGIRVREGFVWDAFEARRVHRVSDLTELGDAGVALANNGVHALLLLPLRSPGRVHGVMVLATYDDEPFSGSDGDLLAAVAAETGMVLETARLERQVRRSEQRYRAMIEESPLGILDVTGDGTIAWANASAAQILARESAELEGLDIRALYADPEDRARLIDEFSAEGVLRDRPVKFVRGDGRPVYVGLTSRRVERGGGEAGHYEDIIRDISEERELQEKLLRTEKLASLGQMISGIAHELNNPLTGVLGYAQLLEESEIPEDLRADIEKISTDAMRCKRIIENLMRFARKEKPRRGVVSVNEEIETVLELRRYQLSVGDITVERSLGADLPYTMADPHQLQQVFLNLINNAADAIKEYQGSGTLRVTSSVMNGRICVEFRDNGPGIPPETLARIFDPFFTTKEVGKGTGLGLSVSYGIIREHGGEIVASSTVGEGTAFTVELPVERITPPQFRSRDTTRRLRVGGKGARVLVVDDEPSVLAVTQRTLDDDGYRTTGASSGDAALAELERARFDVIVTDLSMPGLDGRGLHARLTADFPALARRLVVLTGNMVDADIEEWLSAESIEALAKPFRVRELRKVVRRVLDGG